MILNQSSRRGLAARGEEALEGALPQARAAAGRPPLAAATAAVGAAVPGLDGRQDPLLLGDVHGRQINLNGARLPCCPSCRCAW